MEGQGMKKIYKYSIPASPGYFKFVTFKQFSLLDIQFMDLNICLWAVTDIQSGPEEVELVVLYTGDTVHPAYPYYLGTAVDKDDEYDPPVYHVWAKKPLDPWNPRHFINQSTGPMEP
jgi:hypothetical protein